MSSIPRLTTALFVTMATFNTLELDRSKVKFNSHRSISHTPLRARSEYSTHTVQLFIRKRTRGQKLGEFLAYTAPVKFTVRHGAIDT